MDLDLNICSIRVHEVIVKRHSRNYLQFCILIHHSKALRLNRKLAINCTQSYFDTLNHIFLLNLIQLWNKIFKTAISIKRLKQRPFQYFNHKYKGNRKTINKAELSVCCDQRLVVMMKRDNGWIWLIWWWGV